MNEKGKKEIEKLAAKMVETLRQAGYSPSKALAIARGWMEEMKAILNVRGGGR